MSVSPQHNLVTGAHTQEAVRRQNLGALLRYVHVQGATSRAELTTRLGLNRSTIGALTADLATAGLIDEGVPQETGRAGRPSLVVRPRSAQVYGYALSIEVDRLRAEVVAPLLEKLNGKLTPAEAEAVERAFRLFQNKLLHGPLAALQEATKEGHHGTLLEAVKKLFRLGE